MGKGKSANALSKSTKLVLFCAVIALIIILWNSVVVSKRNGPLGVPSVFNKELSETDIDALPRSEYR